MSRCQEKIFSFLRSKLAGSRGMQCVDDKLVQICTELINYIRHFVLVLSVSINIYSSEKVTQLLKFLGLDKISFESCYVHQSDCFEVCTLYFWSSLLSNTVWMLCFSCKQVSVQEWWLQWRPAFLSAIFTGHLTCWAHLVLILVWFKLLLVTSYSLSSISSVGMAVRGSPYWSLGCNEANKYSPYSY